MSMTALLSIIGIAVMAQQQTAKTTDSRKATPLQEDVAPMDSISIMMAKIDSMTMADSALAMKPVKGKKKKGELSLVIDSTKIEKVKKLKRDWATWTPDPQRALWLALVIPGAGQIYNRKYWKLPLVYGGFMGCIYAMTWNNTMYKDYSQAYLDIMDDDPNTDSYNKFLHLGAQITDANMEQYKKVFKSRKDRYRRWRDMSFFVMVGVYALSVIDAYVDAELSVFDISKDLSLKVKPTVIPNMQSSNPLQAQTIGVNCSLNF